MKKTEAERRVLELRKIILRHDRKYYVENAPEISDYDYDLLMKELESLEKQYPELITKDSPTQRVGAEPIKAFLPVHHSLPMMSISNTYSTEELAEFDARVRRLLPGKEIEYVAELKIDGVAVSLRYEEGALVRAATRGDGYVGEDVTANVRTIRSVPLQFAAEPLPPLLEVRGEIYMSFDAFQRCNREREEAGEPQFANPRNAAAGSLKLLDSRITAKRGLKFFGYSPGMHEGVDFQTQWEFLDFLNKLGLPVNTYRKLCPDIEQVISLTGEWAGLMRSLNYQLDGIVIKVNSLDQQERLGATSKAPRGLVAFKFQPERAVTKLLRIDYQVGKTGMLTPVARLEPVKLAGSTIQNATLHNFDEIMRKDIHVGDEVEIEKAGEVIPEVVRVSKHSPHSAAPKPVGNCPVCGFPAEKDAGGVYYRCNYALCSAQVKQRIRFFATRSAMDIEGLGPALVEQLVDKGLVKDVADLYYLKPEQLSGLERMGRKSGSKVHAEINESKKRDLNRLITALGVRQVGSRAEILAQHFATMEKLTSAAIDELVGVPEVGEITAKNIVDFFSRSETRKVLKRLADAGVNMRALKAQAPATGPLAGKRFVVTGILKHYTRPQIEDKIKELGGQIGSSVSRKTDYVLAGESPGSKLDAAKSLGVKVLEESGFEQLVKRS